VKIGAVKPNLGVGIGEFIYFLSAFSLTIGNKFGMRDLHVIIFGACVCV
jgi:hypothetical protein